MHELGSNILPFRSRERGSLTIGPLGWYGVIPLLRERGLSRGDHGVWRTVHTVSPSEQQTVRVFCLTLPFVKRTVLFKGVPGNYVSIGDGKPT